jgi:hypothetical protein
VVIISVGMVTCPGGKRLEWCSSIIILILLLITIATTAPASTHGPNDGGVHSSPNSAAYLRAGGETAAWYCVTITITSITIIVVVIIIFVISIIFKTSITRGNPTLPST